MNGVLDLAYIMTPFWIIFSHVSVILYLHANFLFIYIYIYLYNPVLLGTFDIVSFISNTSRKYKKFYFRHFNNYTIVFIRRALISHNANFSAVAEHAMRENHEIIWDEARVIDGNDKWIQRCHLEGWYIRLMKSAMNRDEGFLPSDYDYLIRMVRNRQGSSNSHEH